MKSCFTTTNLNKFISLLSPHHLIYNSTTTKRFNMTTREIQQEPEIEESDTSNYDSLLRQSLVKTNEVPRTTTKKTNILPKSLLEQVSDFVRQNCPVVCYELLSKHGYSETCYEGCVNEQELKDKKMRDLDGTCDLADISVLFTDKFDKEFQRSEKKRNRKKVKSAEITNAKEKKKIPSHFVALQIKNEEIHSKVKDVQLKFVAGNEILTNSLISPSKLHITLFVMLLSDDRDIERATLSLDTATSELKKDIKGSLNVMVTGLNVLGKNVLIANAKHEKLSLIADVVKKSFGENEIFTTDSRSFKPHVTLMKLSKDRSLYRKGVKKIDASVWKPYEESVFGVETISSLQLCAMKKAIHGDYYQVCHESPFTEYK